MDLGLVRKVDIDQEMQQSYLDYAMSVIVSRALPDAKDGLKPVQRRILYAMYDMGLRPDSPTKKSARIVGEVLGKYHPHGDMAVYEAMARLAQDFSIRYPLVEGQGNFGSVDGDPPAAMRYTEARLTSFAMQILADIDRDTVNYGRNFDDSLDEPLALPAAVPNLLVNGASGIAVGMATNIPPHNLGEVVDALVYMLKEWDHLDDIAVDDLLKFVKGPDFPTGGIILQEEDNNELQAAYATGRGKLIVRGRVHAEEMGRGRSRLIITELPYLTNKSSLIERIADLVREGDLEGISDLRDESDRQGMRIVIELKQGADQDVVLRYLYKHTPLQSTFGITLLALVNSEPRLLSLKQALKVYLEHRLEVIRRRAEYDLLRAQKRAHILEGLRVALKNLDEIITLIRNSPDVETARERLIKRYKLSDIQANAILEMPLRRLAALERKKIEEEYKQLQQTIKELEGLLHSPKRMREQVSQELMQVREAYGDARRTQIVRLKAGESGKELLTAMDMTPAKTTWVVVSQEGKISRITTDRLPKYSGRDIPRFALKTNSHQTLYLVSETGRASSIMVETIPEAEDLSAGAVLEKVSALDDGERLAAIFALPARDDRFGERYVVTTTRMGLVKRTSLTELSGPSTQAFTLVKINGGDVLIDAQLSTGNQDIVLVTGQGMVIRFSEDEVRAMGLVAAGVNGIKLKPGDQTAGACLLSTGQELILVTNQARTWRLPEQEVPRQGRYGQGVIAFKPQKNEKLVGLASGQKDTNFYYRFALAAGKMVKFGDMPLTKRTRVSEPVVPLRAGDGVEFLALIRDALAWWGVNGEGTEEKKPVGKKSATKKTEPTMESGAGSSAAKTKTDKKPAKAAVTTQKSKSAVKQASGTNHATTSPASSGRGKKTEPMQKPEKKTSVKPSETTQKARTTQGPAKTTPTPASAEEITRPAKKIKPTEKEDPKSAAAGKPRASKAGSTPAPKAAGKPLGKTKGTPGAEEEKTASRGSKKAADDQPGLF